MTTRPQPLTDDQRRDFGAWRGIALEAMPYMASVLYAVRPMAQQGLGTFAVDKWFRLYIDFDAVGEWGPRTCAEALLHECGHLLADHAGQAADMGLVTGRELRRWNVACDLSLNDDLRDAGLESFQEGGPFLLPSVYGLPDHRIAQFYYDRLSDPPSAGGGFDGCGSGSGGEAAPGELGEADDAGGQAPPAEAAEGTRVRIAVAEDVRNAHGRGVGSVPGGLVEWARITLTPSATPWQRILARLMRGAVVKAGGSDLSYSRRNARLHGVTLGAGRVIYPGHVRYEPSIVVIRDTSGSMDDADLGAVTSEVVAISRSMGVRGDRLLVADVDTEVAATRRFEGAASLAEVSGRGGTDMGEGIAWALARRPLPSAVVVLTDGFTPWPDRAPRGASSVRVVACLVGSGGRARADLVPHWITPVISATP